MAIELIDQYVDRGSFTSDTEFIKAQLREALDAYNVLNKSKVSIGTDSRGAKSLNTELSKLATQLQKTAQLNDKAAATSLKLAKAQTEEAKARKINNDAALSEAKTKDLLARATEREDKARTRANNSNREATRAYKSLVREYNILRKVAEDYGASLGVQSTQYLEAAKRANELNTRLKQIDAGLGNSQRNVGNYRSGFDGLSNSINQISRELPAFAISAQTGFLAISNNLPVFFDEIKRINQEVKTLRQQGQETPGVLQRLANSFFSLQTALSLGVTLLTLYGKEIMTFVGSLFKGTSALNAFAERQRILSESIKESANGFKESFQAINELRINVDLAKKGFLEKDEVVKQYNETIGKTTGQVETLDQVEQALVKNGDAYIKMMLLKAAAQLALEEAAKKAVEAEQARLKQLNDFASVSDIQGSLSGLGGRGGVDFKKIDEQNRKIDAQREERRKKEIKAAEDASNTQLDIARKFQEDAAKLAGQFNFDFFGKDDSKKNSDRLKTFRQDLFQDEQKAFQKQLEELSQDEALSLRSRLEFRRQAAEIEKQLIQEAADFEIQTERDKLNDILNDKDSTKNARINAQNEFNATVADINRKAAFAQKSSANKLELDLGKIKGDALDRQRKQYEEEFKELVESNKKKEAEQDRFNKSQQEIDESGLANSYQERIAILDRNFAKIDRRRKDFPDEERKYTEAKLRIQEEFQIAALQSQIRFAEDQLKIEKARLQGVNDPAAKQRIEKAETDLAGLRISLSQLVANTLINQEKRVTASQDEELQKRIKKFRDASQSALSFLSSFADLANIGNEVEKNRIQEEIDLIEEKKRKEIEAIQATTLSEEEKAARIKIIESQAAARREQLELRQRQLEQRKAQFQKAISAATIVASTAEAVMAALGSKPYGVQNIALAAAAGALGAAQLAVVLATPIPKYKHGIYGKESHPGGLALTNDGGKREVIAEPGKQPYLQSGVNVLSNLAKGTQVFPDLETFTALNMRHQVPVFVQTTTMSDEYSKKSYYQLRRIADSVGRKSTPIAGGIKTGNDFKTYIGFSVYD